MLREALVTLLVAVIVIVVARIQRGRRAAREQEKSVTAEPDEPWYRSPSAIVGFIFAGLVIISSTAVTGYRFWYANQIVQVEVIDPASDSRTIYLVRRRDLGDREFRTVDGRSVSLGSGDRVERID